MIFFRLQKYFQNEKNVCSKFWSKIEILLKNRNFAQKIKMFLKNQTFPQNSKLYSKIDMVVAKILSVDQHFKF